MVGLISIEVQGDDFSLIVFVALENDPVFFCFDFSHDGFFCFVESIEFVALMMHGLDSASEELWGELVAFLQPRLNFKTIVIHLWFLYVY